MEATPQDAPFRDLQTAGKLQKRWLIGIGVATAITVYGNAYWSLLGPRDGITQATLILAGLTAVLAINGHFQGERQARAAWESDAWNRQRLTDADARVEKERCRSNLLEDVQRLDEAMIAEFGSDYVQQKSLEPSTRELYHVAEQAHLHCSKENLMKYACSLSRRFWFLSNRAVQREAIRSLTAIGRINEAVSIEEAREREMEWQIDEMTSAAYDNMDYAEQARQDEEKFDRLVEEMIGGARQLGWHPPASNSGLLWWE